MNKTKLPTGFISIFIFVFLVWECSFAIEVSTDKIRREAAVAVDAGSLPDYIQFPLVIYTTSCLSLKDKTYLYFAIDENYNVTMPKSLEALVSSDETNATFDHFTRARYKRFITAKPGERFKAGGLVSPAGSWNATVGFIAEFLWKVTWGNGDVFITSGEPPRAFTYKPKYGLSPDAPKDSNPDTQRYITNPLPGMRVLDVSELRDFLMGKTPSEVSLSQRYIVPYGVGQIDITDHDAEVTNASKVKPEAFPLVFYFVDDGTEAARQMQHETWALENAKRLGKTYNPEYIPLYDKGITLPRYLGYMVVEKDLKVRFVEKGRPDKDLQPIMDYYNNLPLNALLLFRDREFDKRWSWYGVWEIAFGLQKLTSSTLYVTTGMPPSDGYVPKFAKTTEVNQEELLKYPYFPDTSKFDMTIAVPLPNMSRIDMPEPGIFSDIPEWADKMLQ